MKKLILLCSFILVSLTTQALDASLSYATFKSSDFNYIEVYLHIAGKSVDFVPVTDSTFKAEVEVVILFKQGDQVVKFDKYNLNSPIAKRPSDFIDLKRFGLNNGSYQLIVSIQDVNRPTNAKEYNTTISIEFENTKVQQSGIQLLASYKKDNSDNPFVKNGLLLEPLPYNFYGKNASTLQFYNEVYNTDALLDTSFLFSYYIEKVENGENKLAMIGHKKKKRAAICPILMQVDISKLESGNYNLRLEVRDASKQVVSKQIVFFQRSNPYLNKEKIDLAEVDLLNEFVGKLTPKQLEYSLRAMTPTVPNNDVDLINMMLKKDSVNAQRLYLFSYWTNKNPTNPEYAYKKYIEVANAVDKKFQSGFRYGFETDRGYMYMRYGQPDDIERREEEPSAPPYEVWTYYDFPFTKQSNVKFIFYNPSLAPGAFEILHSTAIGELNNPNWEQELYRFAPSPANGNGNFNQNARRVLSDF